MGGGLRNCVRTHRGGHVNADILQTEGGVGVKKGPKTAYILKERPLILVWESLPSLMSRLKNWYSLLELKVIESMQNLRQ